MTVATITIRTQDGTAEVTIKPRTPPDMAEVIERLAPAYLVRPKAKAGRP